MHERALHLGVTGLLLLGCTDDAPDDDEVGEGTDESGTDESGTDESGTDEPGTDESSTDDSGTDGGDEFPPCGERPPGGGEPGPPTLIAAAFDDDLVIRLTFSEPIASVDEVDPASFRISAATVYAYQAEASTSYYDPMVLLCSFTDACFEDYTDVVELGCAEDDPAALLLRLDIFAGQYLCPILANAEMYGIEWLLLPHYDAQGGISDLDGEPLESIAEHWVQNPELGAQAEGEFPSYPMRIPIPCPG